MKRGPLIAAFLQLLCAIAISPILPGVLLWIVDAALRGHPTSHLWILVTGLFGYPILIVLGLPFCYLFLKRDWLTLWHFLALGGALGCFALLAPATWTLIGAFVGIVPMWEVNGDALSFVVSRFIVYLPFAAIIGMAAVGCFWAIMRPSFPTWRRYIQRKAPA